MHSSDLLAEIRTSRPTAPAALRERVAALADRQPATRAGLHRPSLRRFVLVAAPTVAVLAIATAGAIGLARSGQHDQALRAESSGAGSTLQSQASGTARSGLQKFPSVAHGAATTPVPDAGRLQRYEADLSLRVANVDDLSDATQKALRLTRQFGGFVLSAQTSVPERGRGSAQLVVRIPRDRVQEAIVEFSQLGTILSQQVQIEDLQGQVDDLNAQIATLAGEIARIETQLKNPNLPAETRAQLSATLAADRQQLRQLRQSKAQTTREGELATVSLAFTTEQAAAAPVPPSRIHRAGDRAVDVLAWEGSALLLLLVAVGPLALVAVLVWVALRVLRRRAEARLLEQS